jgi:cold-inducible RNA-binding protein
MDKRLFVGGLPFSIDDQALVTLFSAYGTVESANVIMDRMTNQSKGFGFVEMATPEEAQAAIKALDGTEQGGRKITVNIARPKEERPAGDFGRRDNRGGGGNRW